ncbi:MAG: hypothetical protein IKW30_04830 [Lachnospiraceae bacterium]|nr:hypothetical protein [Lachnospiraceae bacterium]
MKKYILSLILLLALTGCTKKTDTTTSSVNETIPSESISEETNESVKITPTHDYYCDDFILTVDEKQFDLTTIIPKLSSISELYPISDDHLYILGRIDETTNAMMVYNFAKEDFVLAIEGTTMCWVQNKFETLRYLKNNTVYDYEDNIIYQPEDSKMINMIEYVVEDFMVTVTDANYENPEEIWLP